MHVATNLTAYLGGQPRAGGEAGGHGAKHVSTPNGNLARTQPEVSRTTSSPCRERLDPHSGRQHAPVSANPPLSGPAYDAAAGVKILVITRVGARSSERAQLETA